MYFLSILWLQTRHTGFEVIACALTLLASISVVLWRRTALSSAILSANSKRDDRRCCAEQPAGSSMNTCLFMQRDPSTPPSDGSHFPIYRYPQNNRASGSYSVHNGPYNSYSYVHVHRERAGLRSGAGRYSIYVGIPTDRRGPGRYTIYISVRPPEVKFLLRK